MMLPAHAARPTPAVVIEPLDAGGVTKHLGELVELLIDAVDDGASIGRPLLDALERHARRLGRTTLVLDTRQGDASERLYTATGYRLAGVIPAYARSASGALDATAFYYRVLDGPNGDVA